MTVQSKKNLKKRKKKNKKRLVHTNQPSLKTMLNASNIRYEVSGKINATAHGGIGVIHKMNHLLGVPEILNSNLKLFKIHNPYFESDHVLNMTYNIVCDGKYIEDLEKLRTDDAYMDAFGTERIPDPTTAGDFLRRFKTEEQIESLQKANIEISQKFWRMQNPGKKYPLAIIDIDGKLVTTTGEYKEKMNYTYKGSWGFSTLILTEATTGIHLYTVNRGGNILSQDDAKKWLYKAIESLQDYFEQIIIRGDSAYYLTETLEELESKGIFFITSVDRFENLRNKALEQDIEAWELIKKENKKRQRNHYKRNEKQERITEKDFDFVRQQREYLSETDYTPTNCKNSYRLLLVKQEKMNLKGGLFKGSYDEYFFYITNIRDKEKFELLDLARKRANHENKIEQLESGVFALNMPAKEFLANYAYMIIATMAWNMKSYLGLLMPDETVGKEIIKMEYKKFKMYFINFPCQILKTARYIEFRILGFNRYLESLLNAFDYLTKLKVT